MDSVNLFLETAVGWVWGIPLVIALVGTGLFFTIALRGVMQLGETDGDEALLWTAEGSEPQMQKPSRFEANRQSA